MNIFINNYCFHFLTQQKCEQESTCCMWDKGVCEGRETADIENRCANLNNLSIINTPCCNYKQNNTCDVISSTGGQVESGVCCAKGYRTEMCSERRWMEVT